MSANSPEQEETEVWLGQMYVFPDAKGVHEHDVPYLVEFETTTGVTRTRELEADEIEKVVKLNKIQIDKVVEND